MGWIYLLSVVWNLDLLVINRVLVWANHGGQFGQVVLGTSLSVATWSAPLLSFVPRLLELWCNFVQLWCSKCTFVGFHLIYWTYYLTVSNTIVQDLVYLN